MKKKKNEAEAPKLRPGDHVTYDGDEWELVETFGGKNGDEYAVIFGEAGRFSVRTKDLKKLEA